MVPNTTAVHIRAALHSANPHRTLLRLYTLDSLHRNTMKMQDHRKWTGWVAPDPGIVRALRHQCRCSRHSSRHNNSRSKLQRDTNQCRRTGPSIRRRTAGPLCSFHTGRLLPIVTATVGLPPIARLWSREVRKIPSYRSSNTPLRRRRRLPRYNSPPRNLSISTCAACRLLARPIARRSRIRTPPNLYARRLPIRPHYPPCTSIHPAVHRPRALDPV